MICSKCGNQNPNGYTGLCRYCRSPLLDMQATPVKEVTPKAAPKAKKVVKTTKKSKATKKA